MAKRQPNSGPLKPGFPIVGIGASAGGLEALEELFGSMPADTGLTFVVVTHQHPGHTSMLPELLAKATDMPVLRVAGGTKVEPNHVYVAPPGFDLAILNGTLHRMETERKESPRLPIDYFFRSLAKDQRERAICIVLSGAGTDGTLGLREIKAQSGMVMVEQPQSAKYAGMPSSAIAKGLVDYVLPPAAMPEQLIAYAKGPYLLGAKAAAETLAVSTELTQKVTNALKHARPKHILIALESETGQPTLQIADDGTGFHSSENSAGMGLKTMQYRASLIGANLAISPIDTGGTLVTCKVFSEGGVRR